MLRLHRHVSAAEAEEFGLAGDSARLQTFSSLFQAEIAIDDENRYIYTASTVDSKIYRFELPPLPMPSPFVGGHTDPGEDERSRVSRWLAGIARLWTR